MNISKIEKHYPYLKIQGFEFPERIIRPQDYFENELEFMYFIMLNPWFCEKLGIYDVVRNVGVPDITAKIIGCNEKISIEVEYNAYNFRKHKHVFYYTNLIISFIRFSGTKSIDSVPIWSVYRYTTSKVNKRNYIYTLDDDINRDFDES